jgi:hypothetical protein
MALAILTERDFVSAGVDLGCGCDTPKEISTEIMVF